MTTTTFRTCVTGSTVTTSSPGLTALKTFDDPSPMLTRISPGKQISFPYVPASDRSTAAPPHATVGMAKALAALCKVQSAVNKLAAFIPADEGRVA